MSQAEELLNGMSEEVPVHTHPVPDTDTYFVIDPITRKIENTNPKKNVIMQYDHNSERCTFELPRYIDGHDMLECTSVTVNVDNIEVIESNDVEGEERAEPRVNSDAPDMTDLRLHPTDPEKVISSWLISRNSTQLAGILSFHIEYKCVDANGNVVYEWSTDNYNEYEVRARKKNGEAAITPHVDTLEQWRTRIFGAGDSVMANIAAEGEAQVAAVKAESETQQNAVELKGAQTLDTIPEDYTEVDAMADEAIRSKGDAIVCEVSGESIAIKDSSNDHIRGLKLFGKSNQIKTTGAQLAYVHIANADYSYLGVTVSATDDGNIVLHGVTTESMWNRLVSTELIAGETYTLSSNTKLTLTIWDITGDGAIYTKNAGTSHLTFEAPNTGRYAITFANSKGAAFSEDRADIMVNSGDSPLPWEPYSDCLASPSPEKPQEIRSITNPTVNIRGQNLIPSITSDHTMTGITYTLNADGSIVVNGTSTAYSCCTGAEIDASSLRGRTVTLRGSGIATNLVVTQIKFSWDKGSHYLFKSVNGKEYGSFVVPEKAETMHFEAYVPEGKNISNVTVYPQLVLGTELCKYEPHINGCGISFTHIILGIPVLTNGNYTDADGQQWICDEVDLERGVYVQRLESIVLDGSESWNYVTTGVCSFRSPLPGAKAYNNSKSVNPLLCTHYPVTTPETVYTTRGKCCSTSKEIWISDSNFTDVDSWKTALWADNIEVVYVLATPIEIPLTAEEIVAFKALRTNYPNTTILNDAGAWMSVKYNADTKNYVENPKILKLVDSSTGVVYELKIVNGSLTVNPV